MGIVLIAAVIAVYWVPRYLVLRDTAGLSLRRRVLGTLIGPLACWLVAVVPLTLTLVGQSERPSLTLSRVVPGLPASEAGVEVGDVVTTLNGAPVTDWGQLSERVATGGGAPIRLQVRRDDQTLTFDLTPRIDESGRPIVGLSPGTHTVETSFAEAFVQAHLVPFAILDQVVARPAFEPNGHRLFIVTERSTIPSVIAAYALPFALLAMLPLPGLDGAVLLLLAREALTGRKVDHAWHARARRWVLGGVLVVIGGLLVVLLLKNDVARLLRS